MNIIPETYQHVRLLKHDSEQPFGFYIRDGTSVRVSPSVKKVPCIFISRWFGGKCWSMMTS